jgi:hypothetical protein
MVIALESAFACLKPSDTTANNCAAQEKNERLFLKRKQSFFLKLPPVACPLF